MKRVDLINHYFQRKSTLSTTSPEYVKELISLFSWIIKADNVKNDSTFRLLHNNRKGEAAIIARQKGIIAGIEEVIYLLNYKTKIKVFTKVTDGDFVSPLQKLIRFEGTYKDLLAYERVVLNIIGRMSGIATTTRNMVGITNNKPFIAATRKTPYMLLDKKAVAVGQGLTHRLHLADWPLIKDNHLLIIQKVFNKTIEEAIEYAINNAVSKKMEFFEIEVESLSHATAAISTFEKKAKKNSIAMTLLLDNFDPISASNVVKVVQKNSLYERILIEGSGGITRQNLPSWKKTGVDILSMGTLTHSSSNFDVSMEIL